MTIRIYEKELKELMGVVFEKQSYFKDFFGEGIEILEGVSNSETAFDVKTSDIPLVVGEYDTGENVAFGTGTSNSNRFGEMTEVIYADTPVPYTWGWSINVGIDRHTVNADLDEAVADTFVKESEVKVAKFNSKHGEFIAANAGATEELATVDANSVIELFDKLSTHFINKQVMGEKIANVTPEVYNIIVDHPLTTREKRSSANIENNTVLKFKGFRIEVVPEQLFAEGNVVYAYVYGVGKAFTGINTSRTVESENFDGVALQGAGKAGEYIPEANKVAVVAVEKVPAG